ncbi:MAG: zinc metalloprotease HtpX [Euryarchaeota archaeon]|nr:zinc metalloprotease HtpX [Euryarchaeota archaeon]
MGGTLRTIWLIGLLSALMAAIGFAVAAYFQWDPILGTVVFLVIAAVFNIVTLFAGDKIVLKAYKAKIVTPEEAPRLHRIIDHLCLRSGIPKPKIAVIPTENPNAFATGRSPKHATVAATVGILGILNDEELEGVMAHELAHVQNRDMLVMTTAATIAGAISFAARAFFWGSLFGGGNRDGGGNLMVALLLMITAPIAAMLVQLSISRTREYKADATGAKITGKPWALANALRRIEAGNQAMPLRDGNPAHSSLFISNPFRGGAMAGLFATHPPMEKRIERLERMAP